MEQQNNTTRKSRVVYYRAGDRRPEWRAVGDITIHAPELKRPLHLENTGYLIVFDEKESATDLRSVEIHLLEAYGRRPWMTAIMIILTLLVGMMFQSRL
ncbi:MAG: hypothetical protein DCC65_10700 [Planctomycetota bacterium]|nr:MAG: hypothetical protein DCC65_10700 [Planctomycetota bacterium]